MTFDMNVLDQHAYFQINPSYGDDARARSDDGRSDRYAREDDDEERSERSAPAECRAGDGDFKRQKTGTGSD